jgi:hypothetical protein
MRLVKIVIIYVKEDVLVAQRQTVSIVIGLQSGWLLLAAHVPHIPHGIKR